MTDANNKGSRWRHAVEEWFSAAGFETTVRGHGFAGDDLLVHRPARPTDGLHRGLTMSIEAKNHREIALSTFVDQAVRQATAYPTALPVVVAHRRAHATVDDAYVVMPGWAFRALVLR